MPTIFQYQSDEDNIEGEVLSSANGITKLRVTHVVSSMNGAEVGKHFLAPTNMVTKKKMYASDQDMLNDLK